MKPLRDQLAEVGIFVELAPQPWGDIYHRLQTGVVDFYLGGWVCTSADAGDLFDAKVHTPDPASGYGRANYVSYSNFELDALIEDANRTSSVEQRGKLWRQGLAILARELPYVPLFSRHDVYGVRERVQWRPRQDGRIYGRDIRLRAPDSAQAQER
jgi:ABC-type transport system substrate-binding protein